ncbi:hypothetical protein ACFLQ0_04535 [Nitrospinota bacterium]
MDGGLWVTWYDLPKEGEAEYLAWFHEKYLPEASSRPGFLWGAHYELVGRGKPRERNPNLRYADDPSIPSGTEFVAMFGGESTYTFMNPSLAQLAEKESAETREMLGRRIGARTCIFAEETRVEGPEIARRPSGTVPGPVIEMGSFNLKAPEDELEMGAWYAQLRLPALERMRGCIGVRKLVSSSGWAKHSILYEFVSTDVLEHFPGINLVQGAEKEWSIRVVGTLYHAPGSPTIGKRIWPPV